MLPGKCFGGVRFVVLVAAVCLAQLHLLTGAELPPLPKALGVPAPGAATDGAYAPQPILPGGVVIPRRGRILLG